jgi:hypothetical protein
MQAFINPSEELADLPCPTALVAGTFALMTAWAAPDAATTQRSLIARKIVSNLFFLRQHPALGEPLRRVLANAHEQWLPIAAHAPTAPLH